MKKFFYFFIGFLLLGSLSPAQQAQTDVGKPIVIKPCYFDISPPLREMYQNPNVKLDNSWKDGIVKNHQYPKELIQNNHPGAIKNDPNVQYDFGVLKPDTTSQSFDGVGANNGVCPPDPAGDVGPNHYVQVVNLQYAIYNKSGVKLVGPINTSQLWSGMSNNSNDGDAIILYDEQADRWLITQFSLPNYPSGPYFEMLAVSQTNDPTGSYYRYQYNFTEMPDYPKLGVWPDGYYICVNRFNAAGSYKGPGAGVFDRSTLLAGTPAAAMIFFPITNTGFYHGLPADCDGTFPPAGTPNYFVWSSTSKLTFYELHADWTTPSNSTFTQAQQLTIIPFSTMGYQVGLPQKGTSTKIDPLSYGCSLMNRLQFRNFGDHWAMVVNGTADIGSSVSGIRWYEFRRNATNPWSIYQQATYAPGDGNSRWCGSMAMDSVGNIGMAFSITSANMFPSIHYVGRMSSDPLNIFTITESSIVNGGGSQTNTWSGNPSRWGDYSALNVDPSNAATFWYTNEYYATTSSANWKTRIASFSFANFLNVNASATPPSVCTGQSSQLNATATGGSGTYTYSWTSVPAGFTSNIENPVVTPTQNTQYVVAVSDGTQSKNDTVMLIYNSPEVNAGDDATYPEGTPLFPCSGTAVNCGHVKWTTLGDGYFSPDTIAATLYHTGTLDRANKGVVLHLKGYAAAPCTDSITDEVFIILTTVGISPQGKLPFDVRLMPNPTRGIFFINISGTKDQQLNIVITDVQGTVVFSDSEKPSTDNFSKQVDLTALSKGTYIVKVQTEKLIKTQKLIIQ